MNRIKVMASLLLAGLLSAGANAATITFDDAYPGSADNFYAGLTITGNHIPAVIGGNGNGDPGNWNLEGTNGSAFLGCNSGNACQQTFTFDNAHTGLSLDLGMPGFNWSANLTVTSFLNGLQVATQTVLLSSQGDPGPWTTVSLAGTFDQFTVGGSFINGFAYGIDNIQYDQGVPAPLSLLLFAIGLAALSRSRT